MEMNLTPSQTQTQRISAQRIQSVQVLQMGTVELVAYIAEAALENPLLEAAPEEASALLEPQASLLSRKLEWMDAQDWQNHHYHRADYDSPDSAAARGAQAGHWQQETLYECLTGQIAPSAFSSSLERAVRTIIAHLDARGYFQESLQALANCESIAEGLLRQALKAVQRMEPAGVGARNVVECLLLQLARSGEKGLPMAIVKQHLQDMCHDRYHAIAKKTGASRQQVQDACDVIRALNPKPGAAFHTQQATVYVQPDILVAREGESLAVLPLRGAIPQLSLSGDYLALLRQTDDEALQDYLQERLKHAQTVMQSVSQRGSTLLACAQRIVARQRAFFQGGASHLEPLSLKDVAADVQLHESTVSRAIKDKWLQCDFGVFPLHYFFSRSLQGGEDAVSVDHVKAALTRLIEEEDKQKPLSDARLAAMLAGNSIPLSRRTVAKYRDQLGIPSTAGRRKY